MNHVFVCIDHAPTKQLIVDRLHSWGLPFIDVGTGIYKKRDILGGILLVTTSVPDKHDHLQKHLSFAEGDANADYEQNIQIADLNALNAALAVIKWKKLAGFYSDFEKEHHSAYTIDGNTIANDDAL